MNQNHQKADEVAAIVGGCGGPVFLKNMVTALSMCSRLNSPEQNQRLEAGRWALKHRKAYSAALQRRIDARHKRR